MLEGLIAAACGVLSGYGVGGGTLLLVYLTAVANVPQMQAGGMNVLFFLPTAAMSLFSHIKNRQILYSLALPAAGAGLLGVWLGVTFAQKTDAQRMRVLFGVLLCYIGVSEFFKKSK